MRVVLLIGAIVLCIVVVFVAPDVDLPRTALRSQQAAKHLISGVRATALLPNPLAALAFAAPVPACASKRAHRSVESIELSCLLLC